MPREVLTIQVGQCGNQIGHQFWQALLLEHLGTPCGSDLRNVRLLRRPSMATHRADFRTKLPEDGCLAFFREVDRRQVNCYGNSEAFSKLKARAILIDMEEGVINRIMRRELSHLFDEKLLVTDISGAGNNWAYGHMVYGEEHGSTITDTVATALEACDAPQAFLFLHSLGGGTGSGLGTKTLELVADSFPNLARLVCVVSPGSNDDVITSPYNAVFALTHLKLNASCVLPFCNDSLMKKAVNVPLHKSREPFGRENEEIVKVITDLTSSIRWGGPLRMDITDISSRMVPYHGLHFLCSSYSPRRWSTCRMPIRHSNSMHAGYSSQVEVSPFHNSRQLLADVFASSNQLLDVSAKTDACIASAFLLRGRQTVECFSKDVERAKRYFRSSSMCHENTVLGMCPRVPSGEAASLLCLLNSCGIRHHIERILTKFSTMYKKRAHLHHYTNIMEQECFEIAADSVGELIVDYRTVDSAASVLQKTGCRS